HVSCLGIVVLTVAKGGPWEIGIEVYVCNSCLNHWGVFVPEEIHMLIKAGSLPHVLSASAPEIRAIGHIVSFTHTLEENSKIKVFVLTGQIKSKSKSWRAVTNNGSVTGISQGVAAAVDCAVAVKISIHDIPCFPVATHLVLADIFQMGIHFRLGFGNTYRGITPDFTIFTTIVPLIEVTC